MWLLGLLLGRLLRVGKGKCSIIVGIIGVVTVVIELKGTLWCCCCWKEWTIVIVIVWVGVGKGLVVLDRRIKEVVIIRAVAAVLAPVTSRRGHRWKWIVAGVAMMAPNRSISNGGSPRHILL